MKITKEIGGLLGSIAGIGGSIGAVAMTGIAGISGAGLTTGLVAVGGTMLGGLAVVAAAPIVIGAVVYKVIDKNS